MRSRSSAEERESGKLGGWGGKGFGGRWTKRACTNFCSIPFQESVWRSTCCWCISECGDCSVSYNFIVLVNYLTSLLGSVVDTTSVSCSNSELMCCVSPTLSFSKSQCPWHVGVWPWKTRRCEYRPSWQLREVVRTKRAFQSGTMAREELSASGLRSRSATARKTKVG